MLDNGINDDELSIPGFNLIRLDRNCREGGVVLYIIINFAYKVIYLGDDSFDGVIVCILRCYEANIEESKKASRTQDTWLVQPVALPLSYDNQTTTSLNNPLYVLHRWD